MPPVVACVPTSMLPVPAPLISTLVTVLNKPTRVAAVYTLPAFGPVIVSDNALPLTSVPVIVKVTPESSAELFTAICLAQAVFLVAAVED